MTTKTPSESFFVTAGKIAAASAVSFFVWKLLQATVGVHMDRALEARLGRKVT